VATQPGKKKRKFRFKNKLLSLDATVIALCASVFDWAQFRRIKGAVKLHLLLDHEGHLPSFAVVSEGKRPEVQVARQLHFPAGTILAIDRGYCDYQWFADLSQQGVYFVTRLKDNADYEVVEERELPQRKGLRRDQVIFLYKLAQAGVDCFFRRVEYYDEESDEVLVFLTNHLTLAAATIAAVYRDRWAIELFFENSTWCTPSYVMEFPGPVAWNRALVGWWHGPVRPCIARHLLCT
jgi:hypothetical protein